jgi:peptidoglycan/xylan/chitin deacetylase (PgdA/CDA1 family)
VHSILKHPIERALASRTVSWTTRHRVRGKRLILAYHGIVPHGDSPAGERTLFIAQRDFAAHLDMLSEVADIAPLDLIDDEGDGRPRIAITLDDAYRGAVQCGVAELAKRGIPATIFVAPGRLDDHVFWWDALASKTGELEGKTRQYALGPLAGSDERVRLWAARETLNLSDSLPEYARAATREELRVAVGMPGITVGSHTWSHPNLANLGISDVMSEICSSRTWLRREFPTKTIDWLAYPYGLDSIAAHHALAEMSYTGAVRITGGWHRASQVSRFARPRLNVPAGLSVAGLKLRTLGAVTA